MKKNKLIIIVVLAAISIFTYRILEKHAPQASQAFNAPSTPSFVLAQPLIDNANRLGINLDDLRAAHTTLGDPSACNSAGAAASGCTLSTKDLSSTTITVSNTLSDPEQEVVLAYEYLHYVWQTKTSEQNKAQLRPLIAQVAQSNPRITALIHLPFFQAEIKISPEAYYDELHSIEGTEVSNNELPTVLLSHYRQYIPHQDLLPSIY